MKINNVKCTQFAGMRGTDISFSEGVNVVFGVNESGKSTLANLICRTLFQRAKIDARSDKDFKRRYFPTERKNASAAGDFIDGCVTFETENGVFTLSKEWGSVSGCRLETPDGIIADADSITQVLQDELSYGEGVFSEMLLPSQAYSQPALETLLDRTKKTETKSEIVSAVSRAFAQSDDISIEALETAIDEKISAVEGDHWDFEQAIPKKNKAGRRWSKGLGEIVKAYYALEDVKQTRDNILLCETELDRAAARYAQAEKEYDAALEEYEEFGRYEALLDKRRIYTGQLEKLRERVDRLNAVKDSWPRLLSRCAAAKRLLLEEADRRALDSFEAADKLMTMIGEKEAALKENGDPSHEDIQLSHSLLLRKESLERRLEGINLLAKIKLEDGYSVTVTSVRTGEEIPFSADMEIKEAVVISVPNVMEIKLSEGGTEIDTVTAEIGQCRTDYAAILEKYGASCSDALEDKYRAAQGLKMALTELNAKLKAELGQYTYDDVKSRAEAVADAPREMSRIQANIISLCGKEGPEKFIAAGEALIGTYTSEFTSVDVLSDKLREAETEMASLCDMSREFDDIPEEFANISNPAQHLELLKNNSERLRIARDAAYKEKSDKSSRLLSYRQTSQYDPQQLADAQRYFDEQHSILSHWKNIKRVFDEQKRLLEGEPMRDIADSFVRYLAEITAGGVSADFDDGQTLSFVLESNENLVDYQKLSEGTKESVFLAFRLAVLDHLYPDGGMIVLDDPFTDMDNIRASKSAELVKKCAEKHQIIVLTCREEYIDALGGNLIRI